MKNNVVVVVVVVAMEWIMERCPPTVIERAHTETQRDTNADNSNRCPLWDLGFDTRHFVHCLINRFLRFFIFILFLFLFYHTAHNCSTETYTSNSSCD